MPGTRTIGIRVATQGASARHCVHLPGRLVLIPTTYGSPRVTTLNGTGSASLLDPNLTTGLPNIYAILIVACHHHPTSTAMIVLINIR